MYKFNIERYFLGNSDIAVTINATKKTAELEINEDSTIKSKGNRFWKHKKTKKDENLFKIKVCKDRKLIRDFECSLNEVLSAIRWSQTDLVSQSFFELGKKYSQSIRGTFLEILFHLMAVLVYGIYRLENNNKKNFDMFCYSLDKIVDYADFFFEDHQTIFYAFQALRLARVRKDDSAITVLDKINIECEPAFRAYLFQQIAIVYQLLCDFDLCLYYTNEAIKLFAGSNCIDRGWFMKNIAVWCYLKLENFVAARMIIDSFLLIAKVSDHERYRLMSCMHLGYLYYFEFKYDEAYDQFSKLVEKNKYETKTLLFLLSLKLKGHSEYAEDIGAAFLNGSCWEGYYYAALYFQSIYDKSRDNKEAKYNYIRVMKIFDNNRFTIMHDVIINEHKMFENYCRVNKFLLLQRNFEKLKEIECSPITVC